MESEYKDAAVFAAKEAGKILMDNYHQNLEIKIKAGEHNASAIVTKADLESERKISSILKERFPDFGIYGEEFKGVDMDSEFIWYVDPLDGTSNFVRHIPLFGISIGLVHLGQPILGILYFPALDILVYAEEGKGCFVNGKITKVSDRPLDQALYYAGGKFKGEPQLDETIAHKCNLVKIIDASSYELAHIAMGDAEIYSLANVPHDVVAGVCIVREAGGLVTDREGNPWKIDSKTILATNGRCHRDIIAG